MHEMSCDVILGTKCANPSPRYRPYLSWVSIKHFKKRLVSCPDQTKRHFFNEVSSGFEISGCSFSSLSAAGLTASVARKRKLAAPIHPSHPLIPHLVQCSSSQGVDVATIYLLEEPEKSRAEQNH